MQHRHAEQLKVEEKKLEVAQAKAKAKADGNEAFPKRIEAGNGTPLEEKQLKLKILAEEIRQQKAELELEKARKKAERAATAPRPPAAAEEQPAPMRAAKRAAEASTTEAKRRRKDPNSTAAPTTEAREYKVGEIVKLKSKNDGKEFDGIIKSKEDRGCYRVFVKELEETILRKLPLRAASSN